MRRRIKDYFSGASLTMGIVLSIIGVVLTAKNDTTPMIIESRWFWITISIFVVVIVLLVHALYNQDKKMREVDEYRVERCYTNENDDVMRLKIEYIPVLSFDCIVSIAVEVDEREVIIGTGVVINIKRNSYVEIGKIQTINAGIKDDPWVEIKRNDKSALNKAYILPTIKLEEGMNRVKTD